MARLYVATGDGIVRLDEAGDRWIGELLLAGSGASATRPHAHRDREGVGVGAAEPVVPRHAELGVVPDRRV